MESGQCLVDGLFVSFVIASSTIWLAGLNLDLVWKWCSMWCVNVWWRGLEAGQFPMFGHIGLLDSSSVLGDVRFEWLYLSSLIYVCLMAVWELRSGWRSLPWPQKLKPGLHACFNWFPRFHYGLVFLEDKYACHIWAVHWFALLEVLLQDCRVG